MGNAKQAQSKLWNFLERRAPSEDPSPLGSSSLWGTRRGSGSGSLRTLNINGALSAGVYPLNQAIINQILGAQQPALQADPGLLGQFLNGVGVCAGPWKTRPVR